MPQQTVQIRHHPSVVYDLGLYCLSFIQQILDTQQVVKWTKTLGQIF